jgi:hypothetical protein
MLMDLGVDGVAVYEGEFEEVFLAETRSFYQVSIAERSYTHTPYPPHTPYPHTYTYQYPLTSNPYAYGAYPLTLNPNPFTLYPIPYVTL